MVTITPSLRETTYAPVSPTTDFPVGFPIFGRNIGEFPATDLEVVVNDVARTDFTVVATFNEGVSTDAIVRLASGVTGAVIVRGKRTPRRTDQYANGAPLRISDHNYSLDRIEAELQELSRDSGRSILGLIAETAARIAADALERSQRIAGDAILNGRVDQEIIDRADGDKALASLVGQAGSIEVPLYDTSLAVSLANIKPTIYAIRTGGYSVPGDGGDALYKRAATEPSHAEKVQSADGAWWEKVENDLAQFAIQKAFDGQPITIGMYGTSITYSQDGSATGTNPGQNGSSNTRSARPIPEELAEVLSYVGFNATVLNRGYPGDTTIEGLSRWASASPVDIAIIEYAHNDANNYGGHAHGPVSLTNYKKNLRQIATREIAKGAAVLFVGAPCEQSPNPANKIAMYIAAAREIAGELGAIFIDWGDSVTGLKNRYTDGVHLSVQANVNIAWDMAAHLVSYTPLMKKVSVGDVLYVSDGYARTTGNLFDWSDTTSKWDGKLIELAPTQWLVAALDISGPAYLEFVSVNGSANATVIGLFYSNYQVVECPTYGHAPSDGPYKRMQTRLMTRGKHIVIVRNDGSSNAYIGPLSVRSAGEPTSDLMEKSEALSGIANPASLEICPAGWRVFCDRGKFLSSEKHGFKLSASIHVKSGEIGIGITPKIGFPLEQMLIAGLDGTDAFIRRLNEGAVVHEVTQVGAISGAGLYQIELLFSDGVCKMFIDGANVLTEPFANLDGTPCVAMFDTFRGCVQAFLTDPSSRPDDKL